VIIATGVTPRVPDIDGIQHDKVLSYIDVITGKVTPGERVAIIGAGGIGFDVATLLASEQEGQDREQWLRSWGVDSTYAGRGGLLDRPDKKTARRELYLLQRKPSKPGAALGKTTGWIHRTSLRDAGVAMLSGVKYERIDDRGLHIIVNGTARLLEVDHVVICAGQDPNRALADELAGSGMLLHVIGGADRAADLDAERAIRQGVELAATI